MTADSSGTPPRLGRALLERIGHRNEALAGDLVEGFHLTQSSLWFWRQLLCAIAMGRFRRPFEVRPLRLVERPSWRPAAADFAASRRTLQTMGLAASPIGDAGGIGIAAIVLLALSVRLSAFTIPAIGIALGLAFGLARILVRRLTATGGAPARHILFEPSAPQ